MRYLSMLLEAPRGGDGGVARVLIVVLILLAAPPLAPAQLTLRPTLAGLNRKLAGHVDDYSHNEGSDRRIMSPILGQPRDLYVYVPPGYSPRNAYPLIFYFHPAAVDERIFLCTNWIQTLDSMIRRGEFPPVVVACPDGLIDEGCRIRPSHSLFINGCHGRFQDHIVQEVLPFLMRCYSIRPEREAHALLGSSAGGFGAMNLALKRRDLFGAVATLAGPVNMRYFNVDGRYREDFDPATYRWKERYDPNEVVGVFYFGLSRVRAKKYIRPVFGEGDVVSARIIRENPADLLFSTDLKPYQLAIYVNYPGRDNWNFDAQAESFAWLAALKGVEVTVECDPCARHNLPYFRDNNEPAYRWLRNHLLPPIALAPGRAL